MICQCILGHVGGFDMDAPQRLSEDVESWETMMFLYHSAIKEVGTKLEILNDEFQHVHQYNPQRVSAKS